MDKALADRLRRRLFARTSLDIPISNRLQEEGQEPSQTPKFPAPPPLATQGRGNSLSPQPPWLGWV